MERAKNNSADDFSVRMRKIDPTGSIWQLHVDGASNARGAGADVILTNPDREKLRYALHYGFQASKNEAEYKALIVGLELAKKLNVQNLRIHCDSQLIVSHVKGDYIAKEPYMIAYLAKRNAKLNVLSSFEIIQISREEKSEVDALARLGSGIDEEGLRTIPVEFISRPSVSRDEIGVIEGAPHPTWMLPITDFLRRGALPEDRKEAEKMKSLASKYVLRDDTIQAWVLNPAASMPRQRRVD